MAMRFASIGFSIWMLVSSLNTATAQWENFHPTQRLQGAGGILQHHFDRMRNGGVHPGQVIMDDMYNINQQLRYRDFVTVENPPGRIKSNHTLKVKYQCSQSLVIVVFMEGNYLRLREPNVNLSVPLYSDADMIFFKKYWPCERSPVESKIELPLIFPRELLERPSVLLPKVWTMKNVNLKVAMVDKGLWNYLENREHIFRDTYHVAFEKSHQSMMIPLKFDHPYARSKKAMDRSFTWPFEIYNSLYKSTPPKSVPDDMSVSLINHPIITSERTIGLPRNFMAFRNRENYMPLTTKDPRYTMSFTLFVSSPCEHLCAITQHVDDDDKYGSPNIFLTNKNQIHFQGILADNVSYVVYSDWAVPLQEWVRVDIQHFDAVVNLTMRQGERFEKYNNTVRSFHLPMAKLDYTNGFFTAGSSLFAPSFKGVIGSADMWRNMLITSEEIPTPPRDHEMFALGLEEVLLKYAEVEKMINRRWGFLSSREANLTEKTKSDICLPYFVELIHPPKNEIIDQCPLESEPLQNKFRHIEQELVKLSKKNKRKHGNLIEVLGKKMYAKAGRYMNEKDRIKNMGSVISVLENAATLMHGPSCFLLYVIYENGFGVERDREKAKKYIFTGALNRDRMSIKTLAHKYSMGEDGFPLDEDVAFFYYMNAAHTAQMDRQTHEEGMTEVNRVRLTDEKQMKHQTAEDEDLFQWFKHQAGSGMKEATRNLGQLLYWGKQGLKRNLRAAFEYYEQAAQDTDDPNALYDYGITLMKGHGTEVDEERAVEVLHQAAEKESPSAYNTLGWYYIRQEGQKEKAVEYFEKAHELDNIDATYNLAHMHHIGEYPGKERDPKMAFQLYYKSASRGHIESCVRLSYIFACGIRDYLYRNIKTASLWAKPVADLSPVMGELVRIALQAFRSQSWAKSTLYYLAAAETGFEIAGYNTAFLCEEEKGKEVCAHIKKDCVWRFWNSSAHYHVPAPYALNKIGDYYYYGMVDEPNIDEAIKYYTRAARMKDPQALFNMAVILEEHSDRVDNETLAVLDLSDKAIARTDDAILELYQMCSSLGSEENSMPCYMGYLRMKCIILWKYSSPLSKVAATIFAIGASTLVIFASTLLRQTRRTDNMVLTEQGSEEEAPDSGIIRTRVLQEETIEHEVIKQRTRSDTERSRNGSVRQNHSLENGGVNEDGSCDGIHEEYTAGKSLLEESSDDEATDEVFAEDGKGEDIVADEPIDDTSQSDENVEDAETGESKKSV